MKIILCGYHWTGCKALELLLEKDNDVYVYTHKADKMVPDLEALCKKRNIEYSTQKISVDNMPFIPDVICSIYYRYIISEDVINSVKGKIFNLHPALLPKYRGCSSLTWAMINGERECGYTFHYIDKGCDTGRIIIQNTINIEEFDTQLTLYNRVMFEAMKKFTVALDMVNKGYEGVEQEGEETFYPRGCPYDGKIQECFDDTFTERFIRAMIYPPYPLAEYKGHYISGFEEYTAIKAK